MWVRNVLENCLRFKAGESLLVVVDQPLAGAGAALVAEANRIGAARADRFVLGPLAALPSPEGFTTGITLLSALPAPGSAATRLRPGPHGRWLFGAPIDGSVLACELMADYTAVAARTEETARGLEGGNEVRLTSKIGTDLCFRIGGRPVFRDGGVVYRPGDTGNLPAGEAFVAPHEESASGRLVVDLSITGRSLVRPVAITFDRGRVISADHFGDLVGRRIGEFGIGTNPAARITGRTITDEKVLGTAHIGLGHNLDWGGHNGDPDHLDCVVGAASIFIDGRRLL